MKKVFGWMAGALALAMLMVGCGSKKTPEALVEQAWKDLGDAQYLDTDMDLAMDISAMGMSMKIAMDGKTKMDKSGDFPVMGMDISLKMLGESVDMELYVDENGVTVQAMDESNAQEFSRAEKEEIKEAMTTEKDRKLSDKETVTSKNEDEKTLVTVVPDQAEAQDFFKKAVYSPFVIIAAQNVGMEDFKINKIEETYVFSDKNKLEEIRTKLETPVESEGIEMPVTMEIIIKINSIGEKLEIKKPATETDGTQAA